MKKGLLFVTVVALALTLTSCVSQTPATNQTFNVPTKTVEQYKQLVIDGATWTVPVGIDPNPLGGLLSEKEARHMGLHKAKLSVGNFYQNEIRSRHTFEVKYLEEGTDVWEDKDNVPKYLVSCGNQIALVPATPVCPQTVSCPSGNFSFGKEAVAKTTPVDDKESCWFDWFEKTAKVLFSTFLLLAFSIILLCFFFILWKTLMGRWRKKPMPTQPERTTSEQARPPVVDRASNPTPATTPNPEPVVPPTPTGETLKPTTAAFTETTTHHGPFQKIIIADQGTNGFSLVGDGKQVGIFKGLVSTEDAGEKGHYLVHSTMS